MSQSQTTISERARERERVLRSQAGDREAFRELYLDHAPAASLLLRQLLAPAAVEDALQETFVRLHGALATLDLERPMRPYLLRIARNVALAQLRRSKAPDPLSDEPPAPEAGPAERLEADEQAARIQLALGKLPLGLRTALLLRHQQGLSVRATGEALGVSERTARDRLREATVRLARALRDEGIVPGGGA